MDAINVSLESLGKVLGISPGAIQAALTAEGEPLPQTDIDQFLVSKIQEKLDNAQREGKEEGRGRGTRESLKSIEDWIFENFEIESTGDLKGQIEKLQQKAAKVEINPEDIERSEVFQSKLEEAINGLKTNFAEKEKEFETSKEKWRRQRIESVLDKKAKSLIEQNNFVLPSDETIAETHLRNFKRDLWSDDVDYRLSEDGELQIVSKDGNPLKDSLHNVIGFDDFGVGIAKNHFIKREGSGRETPGNQTTTGNGSTTQFNFNNREDAMKRYNAESDPKVQSEILTAMKEIKE
jgi:hypothetical protein